VVTVSRLQKTLIYTYKDCTCRYEYESSSTWCADFLTISLSTVNVLCYITLMITYFLILIAAKRAAAQHGRSLRWEGIATVLLTVLVLLVSCLPLVLILTMSLSVQANYSSTLWRTLGKLNYLNIMSNLFVYSVTVPSFREFLKLKMCAILSVLRQTNRKITPQGQIPNPVQKPPPRQTS
jgi:hypothetical protein